MCKFCKLCTLAALLALLGACGGGGDEQEPEKSASTQPVDCIGNPAGCG
jgi:hypothetical protein